MMQQSVFGGSRGVSRQCWEWGRYVLKRKQRRIQVILGRSRVTFRRKQRRIQAMLGVGQSLYGGNRGVSRKCWEWGRHFSEEM